MRPGASSAVRSTARVVDPVGIADRLLQFGKPLGVAASTQHGHPALGKCCRTAEPDSATGTGDDRYLHVTALLFVSSQPLI